MDPEIIATAKALAEELGNESKAVREKALETAMGMGAVAGQVLGLLASSQNAVVRRYAAWGLGNMGLAGETARNTLVALLDDRDSDVVDIALDGLYKVGVADTETVRRLVTIIEENTKHSYRAMLVLSRAPRIAYSAVPTLIQAVHQKWRSRFTALGVLRQLGPRAQSAEVAIRGALLDEDARVRMAACRALASLESWEAETYTALQIAMDDSDTSVGVWACFALASREQQPTDSLHRLEDVATSATRPLARADAVEAIGLLGKKARVSISTLDAVLRSDSDDHVRCLAEEAKERILGTTTP